MNAVAEIPYLLFFQYIEDFIWRKKYPVLSTPTRDSGYTDRRWSLNWVGNSTGKQKELGFMPDVLT